MKHDAAIKEIDFLLTGKAAGEMPGSITQIGSSSVADSSDGAAAYGEGAAAYGTDSGAGAYGEGAYGGSDAYTQGAGADPYSSDGASQGETTVLDPANDRYVDRDYKMIPGSKLRQVFAQEPTPEEAYLRVAKRIPVRMGLQMDVRKLAKLLAACSNSPLVIEVRQVRINRHSSKDGAAGGGQSGAYGGGGAGATGVGDGGGQAVGGGYGGGSGAADGAYGTQSNSSTTTIAENHDAPVEIYGVVLIYNPVDAKTLEVKPGEGEEESATDEEADSDAVPDSAA